MGLLPLYAGMEVRFTQRIVAPTESDPVGVGRDSRGKVIKIIPHPSEGDILSRPSAKAEGFVVLNKLPRAVLIEVEKSDVLFHPPDASGVERPGVIALTPTRKTWKFKEAATGDTTVVERYQLPIAPVLSRTIYAMQRTTAESGMVIHWRLSEYMKADEMWHATYVLLSRVRSLSTLLSHGLPLRWILERGPPDAFIAELQNLLLSKVEATKTACRHARSQLKWPARVVE